MANVHKSIIDKKKLQKVFYFIPKCRNGCFCFYTSPYILSVFGNGYSNMVTDERLTSSALLERQLHAKCGSKSKNTCLINANKPCLIILNKVAFSSSIKKSSVTSIVLYVTLMLCPL